MASLTRPDLHAAIELRFPDNTTELITPPIVRAFLHDFVDSVLLAASDKLTLAQALTLPQAQALLAPPAGVQAGLFYAVAGSWNGVASTVYVKGLSPAAFDVLGVLLTGGVYAPVLVDVAAGTVRPLLGESYTKAESEARLAQVAATAAAATAAQQGRLDALLAGANPALNTFLELFNRFLTDESVAAALTSQLNDLQTVQQQQGQQLASTTAGLSLLSAQLFGRNRGANAANTAYLKYDFVSYQGAQYYATAAFTSGASFEASKWTAAPASAVAAPVSGRFRGVTFLAKTFFKQNDWFLYQDVMLAAKLDFTTGTAFDEADWKKAGHRPGVQFDQEVQVSQTNYPGGITLVNRRAYFFDDAAADVTSCTLPAADPSGAYGLVLLVRNALGSGKAVTLTFTNGGTVDGQASLVLAEGEWRQLTQNASPVRPGDFTTQLQGGPGAGTGAGPATVPPQELQFSTPDNNNRVSVLALTDSVTLLSAQALAGRNCQALSYQVNTYEAAKSAWLPGAERLSLADTQADIALLTADQYAHGAELLFRVSPVDATKAARGIVKLTAPGRLVMPSGTRASLRQSSSLLYSSFLAFYEARTAGNTPTYWQDLSGNGHHLSILTGAFSLGTDSSGRTVYRNVGPSAWSVPALSATPSDYTFYFLIRPSDTSYSFLFDSLGGRLILPVNGNEGPVHAGGWITAGGNNLVAAGQPVVLTWRLNSVAAASLLHNNVPFLTTSYRQVALAGTTALGRRSEADMFAYNGDLIAWGVSLGNDSDDEVDATNKFLLSL